MAAEFVQIAYHNQSLPPFMWGSDTEEMAEYITGTPAANVEAVLNSAILKDVEADPKTVAETVYSLHASFNDGTGPYGKIADRQGLQRSGRTLELVETAHKIRPGMAVVGYSDALPGAAEDFIINNGGLFLVQPTAEQYLAVDGELSLDALMRPRAPLGSAAIRGVCLDNSKFTAGLESMEVTEAWMQAVASGKTYQAHVSANRWDMAPPWARKSKYRAAAQESREDYQALRKSPNAAMERRFGRMLVGLINEWQAPEDLVEIDDKKVLRMVVELAPENPIGAHRRHVAFMKNLVELIDQETNATVLPGMHLAA